MKIIQLQESSYGEAEIDEVIKVLKSTSVVMGKRESQYSCSVLIGGL